MSMELGVRIVEMPPMRVASFRAESAHPEIDALKKLKSWADERNLRKAGSRIFGFDNPGPSRDRDEYGYEVWMTVGAEVKEAGEIKIKEIPGGPYAVTRSGLPNIGETWKKLANWCKNSPYTADSRQWLEEHLNLPTDVPEAGVVLDLYLPVEK